MALRFCFNGYTVTNLIFFKCEFIKELCPIVQCNPVEDSSISNPWCTTACGCTLSLARSRTRSGLILATSAWSLVGVILVVLEPSCPGRYQGSFDIVHVKDIIGHVFATRLDMSFIGKVTSPTSPCPSDQG